MSGRPAEDVRWVELDDPSAVGGARRAAEKLADRLGFPEPRIGEIGIAVTEIASNVQRHGGGGALLLRAVREPRTTAVEVVAVDSGPGIDDLVAARRDGNSTAGTLGIGLGAIDRLSDNLEISSQPGRGTILVGRFDLDRHPHGPPAAREPAAAAGLTRALSGEDMCGDAYTVRADGDRMWMMVADGSGHGPLAAAASRAAVRIFDDRLRPDITPDVLVERIHHALLGTRGAAVAVAALDSRPGRVRFAGVGNIAGAVLHDGQKRSMVSIGGVAGYLNPTIRTYEYPLPPGAVVVMHSDGVRPRWTAADVAHVAGRAPLLLAATLLRDAGVRQDDACVLAGSLGR